MNGRAHKEELLAALRESLGSGDQEKVKWVAESLHKAGGDPVTALSSIALNELPDCDRRTMALRVLEDLDSAIAKSVAQRLPAPPGHAETWRLLQSEVLPARTKAPQRDPSKWWIFGPLIALAILWPAYSVYRFNHPRPSAPPEPRPPWNDQEVRFESTTACQFAIKQQLRDPDSADFPTISSAEVEIPYNGDVKVRGFLHANNGLGLKVRADYSCTLQVDRQAHGLSVINAQLMQR